jgi:hypothetical protein
MFPFHSVPSTLDSCKCNQFWVELKVPQRGHYSVYFSIGLNFFPIIRVFCVFKGPLSVLDE